MLINHIANINRGVNALNLNRMTAFLESIRYLNCHNLLPQVAHYDAVFTCDAYHRKEQHVHWVEYSDKSSNSSWKSFFATLMHVQGVIYVSSHAIKLATAREDDLCEPLLCMFYNPQHIPGQVVKKMMKMIQEIRPQRSV